MHQSTHTTRQQNGSGFNSLLSAYNTQASQNSASTTATGSLLSGDSITLTAQNDLGVHGSQVVNTNDVNLCAGGNVTLGTVTETTRTGSRSESTKNGVFGEDLSTTLGRLKAKKTRRPFMQTTGSILPAARSKGKTWPWRQARPCKRQAVTSVPIPCCWMAAKAI